MLSLRESMRIAAKDYGKSRLSQVLEILRLALGPGYLTAKEYYAYLLFDDSRLSFLEKQQFLGTAGQENIKKFLINDRWRILADDKFIFDTLLRSQGFPLAKILATYKYEPNKRACSIPSLNTTDDLTTFLRNEVNYPFFGKPIVGKWGSGCIGVNALDRVTHQMTLANEQTVTIDQFIENLQQFPDGYMFQERMRPHRVIRDICGDRIATVRIVVLIGSLGPQIYRATWKIPTGKNMTDNHSQGRSGNLVAAINIEDGRVGRVVDGMGVDQQHPEHHPDTGKRIQGFTLPCWRELKEICLEAAMVLPGFRLQSWDIAICEEGPVLQEVQDGGFSILQVSPEPGMLDDHLRQYLGSVNRFWQREGYLSMMDQLPRKIYRHCYPKRIS
jgi:hypothetical protein